jgi:hypothetical protein
MCGNGWIVLHEWRYTFEELVIRAFSRERANITQSSDRGLGVCILSHSMEELVVPVMGASTDHCGGYACDKDARFNN